jgi:hypothetical protein
MAEERCVCLCPNCMVAQEVKNGKAENDRDE